jgi:hypothetical protein
MHIRQGKGGDKLLFWPCKIKNYYKKAISDISGFNQEVFSAVIEKCHLVRNLERGAEVRSRGPETILPEPEMCKVKCVRNSEVSCIPTDTNSL